MGDYTLCHLHFTLKGETPEKILDIISRRLNCEKKDSDPESIKEFSPTDSAYHSVKGFVQQEGMCEYHSGEFIGLRINTIFQVKYSRGIHEFVEYISPWVDVDAYNRGCIGWTLSEYCSGPTYLFVDRIQKEMSDD